MGARVLNGRNPKPCVIRLRICTGLRNFRVQPKPEPLRIAGIALWRNPGAVVHRDCAQCKSYQNYVQPHSSYIGSALRQHVASEAAAKARCSDADAPWGSRTHPFFRLPIVLHVLGRSTSRLSESTSACGVILEPFVVAAVAVVAETRMQEKALNSPDWDPDAFGLRV